MVLRRQSLLVYISSLTLSNHLHLGLPLFLLPCTFISIALLPTYYSSLLITCPHHFNLLSWTLFAIPPTFIVPLILSILMQLRNSANPSLHSHFCDLQFIFLCFLQCPCLCPFNVVYVSTPYCTCYILYIIITTCITDAGILRETCRRHRVRSTKRGLG